MVEQRHQQMYVMAADQGTTGSAAFIFDSTFIRLRKGEHMPERIDLFDAIDTELWAYILDQVQP